MDLMKILNDPESLSLMATMPKMLEELVTTLQEIRDAVILQNRIAAMHLSDDYRARTGYPADIDSVIMAATTLPHQKP